jgi:hypothetical protein
MTQTDDGYYASARERIPALYCNLCRKALGSEGATVEIQSGPQSLPPMLLVCLPCEARYFRRVPTLQG